MKHERPKHDAVPGIVVRVLNNELARMPEATRERLAGLRRHALSHSPAQSGWSAHWLRWSLAHGLAMRRTTATLTVAAVALTAALWVESSRNEDIDQDIGVLAGDIALENLMDPDLAGAAHE
ncbi:hypothetical protein [Paludibacterium paludis]|uniref:DUF3619 family protein n=1 Tax=Paludibacterium paludis TaxID=1225769 RepID=A0A918P2V0_9NEIS|nr:hypothetical protein [Paludibacterium paludis]GGY15566.1 hypothetical protein GCM10011289_18580 [Paludibacterium paludis]